MNQETKTCQNCKNQFTIEPDDFAFYEKIKVPAPTWCPECRMQRRIIWRNEKNLHKRKCDHSGEMIFSVFRQEAPIKVYERGYWWSDEFDPKKYGRNYDFDRPFFEQLHDMVKKVPWPSRSAMNLVNSDYCMNCADLKNCYLVFGASYDEDCYYSVGIQSSKDSFDNLDVVQMEKCYEVFYSGGCYGVKFSENCESCHDVWISKDLGNCSHCVGCVGLRNKQHCIFNQQYSKEEYERKVKEMRLDTYSGLLATKKKFEEVKLSTPVKYMHNLRSENSSGEYIYRSKNVKHSFMIDGSEDLKYCQNLIHKPYAKSCYDYSYFGLGAENVYESVSVGINSANVKFSNFVYSGAQNVEYSLMCPSSQNLFGCVNARKTEYCILNKQYSKEEFNDLVPKIKKHMDNIPYTDSKGRVFKYGEAMPYELCPIPYNDSNMQEYGPLDKKGAQELGAMWLESDTKGHKTTMNWGGLPDSIGDAPDSIVDEVILCKSWNENEVAARQHNCSKAFKILKAELQFYRTQGIPLPRKCFNSRHHDRTLLRNLPRKYDGKCHCAGQKSENYKYINRASTHQAHSLDKHCPNIFNTPYSPDRPEIVYCEQCYQAEVV